MVWAPPDEGGILALRRLVADGLFFSFFFFHYLSSIFYSWRVVGGYCFSVYVWVRGSV